MNFPGFLQRTIAATDLHKPLSLRINFSWILIGNVVYSACQWGMLTVIAKLSTPEMVGQFALGLAVTAPVMMFANLQLRSVQATDARRDYLFSDYLGLRLITTALAFVLIAGLTVIGRYREETAAVILIVGLSKSFEAISDVFFGLLQQRERMDRIAKAMMLKGVLALALMSVLLLISKSLVFGVVGLLAANIITLIAYDIPSGVLLLRDFDGSETASWGMARLLPRWNFHRLQELSYLALPLGFVMMLISLNTNIPRYFIEHYLGERELGIFAAMAYLIIAGTTVTGALGQSATPKLAKYYAGESGKEFSGLLLKMVGIGAVMGATGLLLALTVGKPLLTVLYRPEYAQHVDVFVWLMLAAGLQYMASFLGYGMTAARRFLAQLPLFLAVTVTSVLMSLLLIPLYGQQGAAVALLIAAGLQLVGSAWILMATLRSISGTQERSGAAG
jgi:O-antigen/teichoic acid export membrane protein